MPKRIVHTRKNEANSELKQNELRYWKQKELRSENWKWTEKKSIINRINRRNTKRYQSQVEVSVHQWTEMKRTEMKRNVSWRATPKMQREWMCVSNSYTHTHTASVCSRRQKITQIITPSKSNAKRHHQRAARTHIETEQPIRLLQTLDRSFLLWYVHFIHSTCAINV